MFITAKNLGATSDMFQCGKCKLWKVRFAMAQTGSGDEPMTVFCTCLKCSYAFRR